LQIELEAIYHLNPDLMPSSVIPQVFICCLILHGSGKCWRIFYTQQHLAL